MHCLRALQGRQLRNISVFLQSIGSNRGQCCCYSSAAVGHHRLNRRLATYETCHIKQLWTSTVDRSRSAAQHHQSRCRASLREAESKGKDASEASSEDSASEDDDYYEDPDELSEFPDNPSRQIETGGTAWGKSALLVAQNVLQTSRMQNIELYAFHAISRGGSLDIRLDRLDDRYGSPTLEDVEEFAKAFYRELEQELGEEEVGRITVEVSSPGAEREVRLPEEIPRFKELPMTVTYLWLEDGVEKKDTRVLQVLEAESSDEVSVWQLANVKLNRPQGRPSLTKKQAAQRFSIPYANIAKAQLFIEI